MAILLVFYLICSAAGRHIQLYIPQLQPRVLSLCVSGILQKDKS